MRREIKSLVDAVNLAAETNKQTEVDVSLQIDVNGDVWDCYSISITHRDILCFCKQGTASFAVDTYGTRNTFELTDWESES